MSAVSALILAAYNLMLTAYNLMLTAYNGHMGRNQALIHAKSLNA
jgi:hypothetical protein